MFSFCMICVDLLNPIIDPMSFLEPPACDDDFDFCESRRTSVSLANVEFVDPQYTVKPYVTTQLGYMTPDNSPTDTTPRRESFPSSCFYGSSAASSFMSHSGSVTPSLATPGSSASNSRRQSMLLPECQQYYLSATSSSPSNHSQGPENAVAIDQCPLQDSSIAPYLANTNDPSLDSEGAAACMPEGQLGMIVDSLTGKAPTQWPNCSPQTAGSSWYRTMQAAQIDESTSWSCDIQAKVNNSIAARSGHTFEISQPLFGPAQSIIFEDSPSHPARGAYNTEGSSNPNAASLGPPFEYVLIGSGTDMEIPDDEDVATKHLTLKEVFNGPPLSHTYSPPSDDDLERDRAPSRVRKHNRKHRQSQGAMCELAGYKRESKIKSHQCPEPNCDYACHRHEHLERHIKSKHIEGGPEELPCAFHDCIDRKTGNHRMIAARLDNLKAHYTNTHFKYGSSENGGKNARKSMKESYELGLKSHDYRWNLLLEQKMNVNEEIEKELHVWKMLGYSIRETRDTKVKDVKPDCQKSGDEYLQKFDPRWKALWDGTLTFDKAMSKGKHMKESDAQGLLGVTMLETEAMGIKSLDPRWTVLLSGRMSVEQSEKLGVKQRNPKWKDLVTKRRARCGIEKL